MKSSQNLDFPKCNEAYKKIQNLVEITYSYSPFIIFPM